MSLKINSEYCEMHMHRYGLNIMIMLVLFISVYFVDGEPSIKDKSMVKYVNPKYMDNVEVKMFRRRNDPYKTNITSTLLQAWGPNVTTVVSYPIQNGSVFNISVSGCNMVDKLWMNQLLRQSSNMTDCPAQAGTYRYFNLGHIPKAFPSPAPSSPKSATNTARIEIFLTSTKERMADILLHVYVRK